MSPSLVEVAKKNLDIALRLSHSAGLPDAGWRWQAYRSATLKWVNFLRTPVEVIHAIQAPRSNMGYEARMTGRQLVEYVRSMEQNCLRIFPEYADFLSSFVESPLSYPGTLAVINGRMVSSPLYNHVMHIMRCSQFVHPRTVMEIGGGYGAPGRLWMTNDLNRPQIYIDVDFPESLYFAEIYFRANDQSLSVEYAHSASDIERAVSGGGATRKVILVPIAQINALKSIEIDLLINTGSLQEMSPEYVDFYMSWLNDSKVDYFYSANYFGQKIDQLMEGMNYGAPILANHWKTLFSTLHQDSLRPVAELIFQRTELPRPSAASAEKAKQLLNAVDPISLPVFLELFDLSRNITDADFLLSIVNRSLKMQRIPKETLPLVTRTLSLAREMSPGNFKLISTAEKLVNSLAEIAAQGLSQMGIVDATVANLRGSLIASGVGEEALGLSGGGLVETTGGTEIELAGRVRDLKSGTHGVIESYIINANNIHVSGWALSSSDRVVSIHLFLDGRLVDSVAPDIIRPEFNLGDKPIGFQIESVLPIESAQGAFFFVVAEFEDGTLGKLINGGDILPLGTATPKAAEEGI